MARQIAALEATPEVRTSKLSMIAKRAQSQCTSRLCLTQYKNPLLVTRIFNQISHFTNMTWHSFDCNSRCFSEVTQYTRPHPKHQPKDPLPWHKQLKIQGDCSENSWTSASASCRGTRFLNWEDLYGMEVAVTRHHLVCH